jgi:hypothetical protein
MTSTKPRLRHAAAKAYYAATFLCPPAFRREFSAEMAQDVDEAIEETRLEGQPHALVALWSEIASDLARTVALQWLRTGLPILLPCALLSAVVATTVAAQVLRHDGLALPAAAADRDLMTLIVLTGVVLLVIVSTILFTFWFSRPLLRRHRR